MGVQEKCPSEVFLDKINESVFPKFSVSLLPMECMYTLICTGQGVLSPGIFSLTPEINICEIHRHKEINP